MSAPQRLSLRGTAVAIRSGDDVLTAAARAGMRPSGVLCSTGDCANCLAEVDGVAYVRMCQTRARDGLEVQPFAAAELPSLPQTHRSPVAKPIRHRSTAVVVVGTGTAGAAAIEGLRQDGQRVIGVDANAGEEVIGIYAGPLVVVRTPAAIEHIQASRVIVATGSSALQPVCEGSHLRGILTPAAFERFAARGIEAGTVAHVDTELIGFVTSNGESISGVVTTQGEIACDTAVVDLGRAPRDALLRMSTDLDVEAVGSVAQQGTAVSLPAAGTICPCKAVTLADLHNVWERGFGNLELLKRGSGAGTGTCQGSTCLPYLRSFVAEQNGERPDPFTARPLTRQLTMAEAAAGQHLPALARTALDAEHRALGAHMDRFGGWWRPWTYGDTDEEYAAVRERVSIGDVSTLGTMTVRGPGAEALLQRLYPTDVSTIKQGRSRYVLLLDERGYVFDDGMVARVADNDFRLTFTSGGASHAELWVRDQAGQDDVRIMNTTMSSAAINVTGPLARVLLEDLGLTQDLGFLHFGRRTIADVDCLAFRLSFTGELSYELHHQRADSVALWRALIEAGQRYGIRPHGLEALMRLRLEKGHIVVGQDSDYDSTPRRLDHDWAVNLDAGDFVGRQATLRTNALELDKRLVGLTAPTVPHEGASLWSGDRFAGHITSSAWSPITHSAVMLGWLRRLDGAEPEHLEVETFEGRVPAAVSPLPFYDPEGAAPRG